MSLYVTRHGQTNYNVNNLVCGISPAALTTDGIEQAKELGRQLKSIKYDFLYVSPLQRAIDTADYANVEGLEVIIEPRISEINFGIYEGVHRDDPGFIANKHNLAIRYPKVNQLLNYASRVYDFLMKSKNRQPKVMFY